LHLPLTLAVLVALVLAWRWVSRTYFIYRRVMRCGQDEADTRRPTTAICRYGLVS